jgi:hypothetical protein
LRLYVVANVAGALDPCGCVEDMLGGADHAAALIRSRRQEATSAVMVGAGPMLFMNPTLNEASRAQDLWKAEALADALRTMGLAAWAPGFNDWAASAEKLAELRSKSSARLLAGNLEGTAGLEASAIVEAGGYKIGLAGVSVPSIAGALPEGVKITEAGPALARAKQKLDAGQAQIRIALLAMPRGQAIRLIESAPDFDVAVIGKFIERGEANDAPTPPVLIGKTLVLQPPNHLQSISIVDLFVRGGSFEFKDGSDIGSAERKQSLQRRVGELEQRIRDAQSGGARAEDLAARRADLDRVKRELATLAKPSSPPEGSFFRYELADVREKLGSDPSVAKRMEAYYAQVNSHNREALKDRLPPPVAANQSSFVGVQQCSSCHAEEREFWSKTRHAAAYATLANQHKEFNLDCVGCHVTGYEKPGGSSVTHVEALKDVQCEVCHGPGSGHPNDPSNPALIVSKPGRDLCASECHHPPHVHPGWDVDLAWKQIIGPGHGS